jgi:hypothetical protein
MALPSRVSRYGTLTIEYSPKQNYFVAIRLVSALEYLLGDSALNRIQKIANKGLSREQEVLNDALGGPRVLSEHCIGILKDHFSWLRQLCLKITNDLQVTMQHSSSF